MKKEEYIKRYGKAAYEKMLEQNRVWNKLNAYDKKYYEEHSEEVKARVKKYKEEHPEQIKGNHQEACRKGGRRYEKYLEYEQTGLRGVKNRIRKKHANQYRSFKAIIAPDSQLHHQWVPGTAEYTGLALVEADQHMHGFVKVIEVLDGEITLLIEDEVRRGGYEL